jgi:hypothetical protein
MFHGFNEKWGSKNEGFSRQKGQKWSKIDKNREKWSKNDKNRVFGQKSRK